MGVQDRDWWRERRDRLHRDDPRRRGRTPPPRPRSGGRLLFLLVCLLLLGAILWRQRSPTADAPPVARALQRPSPACADPFPAAGAVADVGLAASGGAVSTTRFVNRTPVDRIVDLMAGERVVASIAVPANQTSAVPLPSGAYGWRLRHGAAWCGSTGAFVREQRTIITTALQIVATSALTVHIEPDAEHPSGFALRTADRPVVVAGASEPASARPLPGGGLLIPRAADGHYYVDGAIDGQRVQFMIDTGATHVAIPADLARSLGYYSGDTVVSDTANGRTVGYAIRVDRVAFGPFTAEQVKLVALPALARPLLGMSLLQSLEIRQTADGLELRRAR